MKSLIFILLLTIGGSMSMRIFNHCEIHECDSLMPKEIVENLKGMPPNAEELKELCPPLIEVMECLSELILECTGQTLEELAATDNETVSQLANFFSNIMKLNYDVCNEDTQLHKNYVQSIPCFRDMVQNPDPSCRRDAERLYGAYREALPESDEEGTFEQVVAEAKCMTSAYGMACTLMQVQKNCGDVAKDTFREVLKRIQFLKLGFCSEGDLVKLKTKFVDFLEEQGEQRDFLVSAFEMRRKK